jgi:cell division protein FtsI (penicillin-binding protein 3)
MVPTEPVNRFQSYADSGLYKFYGMKTDLNTILGELKYQETDSQTSGNWRTTVLQDGRAFLTADNVSKIKNKVPDVKGLGLKDAVYVLENMGLKVTTMGRGKVIYQSLAQNSNFSKGQSIKIQLN